MLGTNTHIPAATARTNFESMSKTCDLAYSWYANNIALSDILIVTDDADLIFGNIRIRKEGSSGGHRGLKSIIEALGNTKIPRLRVGIGRSDSDKELASHVLERFTKDEKSRLNKLASEALDCIHTWLFQGIDIAMNKYNKKNE